MELPELPERTACRWTEFSEYVYRREPNSYVPAEGVSDLFTADQMRAYALEAIAAERERCARICEELAERGPGNFKHGTPTDCAAAIRAQGGQT